MKREKMSRGGGGGGEQRNILTWKTHILNKIKCVYIMQRFVIKNFNVMLKHFKDIPKSYYHTDGCFFSLSPYITYASLLLSPTSIGLHAGFLFSTILDRSTVSV